MLFSYSAIDKAGATQSGQREAADEKILARALRNEGLLLVSAREGGSFLTVFKKLSQISFGGVSLFDRMIFARNMAVMIGAGLSMTRALEAQEEQVSSHKFKEIIRHVRDGILAGQSFSQSLEPYRALFGDFFVHMVEAGEVSGKLEGSLKLLSRQMKRDHDLRAKVRGAMIYPAIVVTVLIGIGILMLIYVVPTLSQTFKELNVKMPLSTRIIMGASDFMLHYILFVLAGFAVLIYLFYLFLRSERGKHIISIVFLRLPVFGPLIKKMNVARMTRTLASLIAAGLSITKSIEITGRVLGNVQYQASLAEAIGDIEKGSPLSETLHRFPKLYPPLVTQMITVGEETGTMSRMLIRIALFYEEDVTNATKNLSSIIEPLMMIIIGAVVGFFAYSMIQPLYGSLSGL